MDTTSAFKSPEGETVYLKAYNTAMKSWSIPFEEMVLQSRFGTTHVVVSGSAGAPPLMLLHGYMATLLMWLPNIADFANSYRVYAIDIMGQPGKSIPNEPIRDAADYVAWLTATLDALRLDRVSLVGMSYGGWLALNYAIAAPDRVAALVLLSPAASFLPIVKQFSLRGMPMLLFPTRFTVNSFMRWLGFRVERDVFELLYLGLKHFRIPRETLRVAPTVFPDEQLHSMSVPTLLLIGDQEVIYDAAMALARARRLIPDLESDVVPQSSHDMCVSQHRIVDKRILKFLASADPQVVRTRNTRA